MLEDEALEYINCFKIDQEKLRVLLEIDLEKKRMKLSKATSENEAMHALIKLQKQQKEALDLLKYTEQVRI